ncbi:MAG: division/cell wall cluster transcriptional repressor MraZ [Actinobacteria bacterium]|nr:division/cell wall cluster transcriptional repressor MraZ [Actinomycetota bacterium]
MFLGEFQHSLDAKGRVILPADFRPSLAEGAVISAFTGGCLAVYTNEEFQRVSDDILGKLRTGEHELDAARAFFADAREVTPDRQGRVAIPQTLRDYAQLDKDVTVTGALTRIEIWATGRWQDRKVAGRSALHEAGSSGFGI